jgi:hypothetical protein
MNEQHIALDVSKRPRTAHVVHIRQGDKNGTILAVAITDNGAPLDLTGLEATLVAKLPDGTLYEVDGEVSGNTATFEMDETEAAAAIGATGLAYVEITGTDTICSTQAFTIEILPAGRSLQ